jgi:membrane-associated phospholipid phosphatase
MFVRGILPVLAVLLPSAMQAQPTQQAIRDECDLGAPRVCVRHVIEDEIGIVKSPLHVRTKDLLWIVPFGVATGVAIHYDAEALNSLGHDPSRQNTFDQISNVGAVYIPIAGIVGGYAAGSWRKDDYLRQTAVLSGEAILDAQIINLPLKYAIDRQTPDQGDGTGRFWPHGPSTWPDGQSMPSGHSLTAWSFAHVVAARYPGWHTRLLMYGLATTVSVSRVMARQHFPSDVLVGGALGYFVGGYVVGRRGEVSRRFSFSMVNTPNGRGAQLSYNFGN